MSECDQIVFVDGGPTGYSGPFDHVPIATLNFSLNDPPVPRLLDVARDWAAGLADDIARTGLALDRKGGA